MRDRRKRNIMIGSLCALLVFMGIGYAIISQMLTIRGVSTVQGDWNIYIDSITPNAVGTGVSINESVGLDKVSASFEANLYAPGDKVEYKVVVKNDGNIDAKLGAVNQHVSNDTDNIVKYSNTLENGYILRHGESYVFYVTTEIEEEKEELPTENTVRAVLDLKLNFTQYTGGGSGEEEEDKKSVVLTGNIDESQGNATFTLYSNGDLNIDGTGTLRSESLYTYVVNSMFTVLSSDLQARINDLGDIKEVVVIYSVPFLTDSITVLNNIGMPAESIEDMIDMIGSELSPDAASALTDISEEMEELGIPVIKKIIFGEGITSLGNNFFLYGGDAEIVLPNSLEHFNIMQACNYIDLSEIDLTNKYADLEFAAPGFCGTIILPNDMVEVRIHAFGNSNNAKIYFPSSVTTISPEAFNDVTSDENSSEGDVLFFEDSQENVPSTVATILSNFPTFTAHYGCTGPDASTCSN